MITTRLLSAGLLTLLGLLPSHAGPLAGGGQEALSIPKVGGSSPRRFVSALGLAFFQADDGETGVEPWRSDGTVQGTFQVFDGCPGECSGGFFYLGQTDRRLLFFANHGSESSLWATEGTPETAVRLGRLHQFGAARNGRSQWVESEKRLYFAADDGVHGYELWRTDGTPEGTSLVADLPGSHLLPDELTLFKGRLFFSGTDSRGTNLWTSDGTAAGTRLVRDVLADDSYSSVGPTRLRVAGANLFFVAPSQGRGYQLWRSDGTTRGTLPLTTFPAQPLVYGPVDGLTALGDRLVFLAKTPAEGQELWVSDGTVAGTRPLTHFALATAFDLLFADNFLPFQVFKNRLYFAANDGRFGTELWSTDGTPQGTRLLRDLCPGPCSGVNLDLLTPSGNLLYFGGLDGVHGLEPWVTDGTPSGTRMVRDLCRGSCGSQGFGFRAAVGQVFFVASDGRGRQVWRTDGTSRGTRAVTRFPDDLFLHDDGFQKAVLGRDLLFRGRDSRGAELWKSDGTVAGTRLLVDLNPDS